MATPLGHALAGVAVGNAAAGFRPLHPGWGAWREALAMAIMAQGPDLDFIPGIIMGNPSLYHHGASHSLGAAVIFAVMVWLWARSRRGAWGSAWRWGLVAGVVYFTQVVIDAWTLDFRPPAGVPIWWPMSGEFFYPADPIFLNVQRDVTNPGWLAHDLKAVALEIALLGPPAIAAMWVRLRRRRCGSD